MNRKERKNFMKPYESYMIISDLDGTIIPHGGVVSEANKRAIESFRAGGGHFGIAAATFTNSSVAVVEAKLLDTLEMYLEEAKADLGGNR